MTKGLPTLLLVGALLFLMLILLQSPERLESAAAPQALPTSAIYIDLCSQHPHLCLLDEATWGGAPDAWQRTGKRWERTRDTDDDFSAIWVWSEPYNGDTPEYQGHRQNPYAYDTIEGRLTYDWERWQVIEGNYRLFQYGKPTEALSFHAGDTDCESGLYFPLINEDVEFNVTSLFFTRKGTCIGESYIASYRMALWGAPLSTERLAHCDHPLYGIPADESPLGNTLCKLSPQVAMHYTRYLNGPGPDPEDVAIVGCEGVIMAWGWPEPGGDQLTGEDYAPYFRNGMLRFTRWLGLNDALTDTLPTADDHAWWNTHCERVWADGTSWLYNGHYEIGEAIYTDTLSLPTTTLFTIPVTGGIFTSTLDNVTYHFAPATFSETVLLTHTRHHSTTPPAGLHALRNSFAVAAVYSATRTPAAPANPYTLTVAYPADEIAPASPETLALYYLEPTGWVADATSHVLTTPPAVRVTPTRWGTWGLFGEVRQVLLPLVIKE